MHQKGYFMVDFLRNNELFVWGSENRQNIIDTF